MGFRLTYLHRMLGRAALVALLCLITVRVFGVTVTATVDRPVITLGETFNLTIAIEGAQVQGLNLPQIPNLTVVGQSQGINIVNASVQQSFTYEMSPSQAGTFTIPAMRVPLAGQMANTQPVMVKVLPPGQTAGGGPPPYFVEIALPKTNLYVGEVVDMQVRAYYNVGRIGHYPQLPSDPGMTVGKWLQPTDSRAVVSNMAYMVKNFVAPVTAVKAGALTIGPVTQSVIVPDNRRASFFFQSEREARTVSAPQTVIALPLPRNAPATFAGAVGQYTVTLSAAPTNLAVGDPLTVRVQVSGRGWLDGITLPPQPQWREFKSYTPNSKIDGGDPNNVTGTKTFEMVVEAQSPDIKALPPFAFSYFDPNSGEYKTVMTPAVPLHVSGAGSGGNLPPMTATNAAQAAVTDIAHIKLRLGETRERALLIRQPWFIGVQFIAPALWLGLVVQRRRSESLARNPKARRKREVTAYVREALPQLETFAKEKRSDDFFATTVRVLQEQIGERLDVPANSVSEATVDERLRRGGLEEGTCKTLHDLLQAANLARYAPVKSSQELAALVPKVQQVVAALQKWEEKR